MSAAVHIKELRLRYNSDWLFDGLNLTLAAGKFTCLLGASGVGKSTLLHFLAGLLPNQHYLDYVNCPLGDVRSHIAFMAQQDSLLPWLTVLENVVLGYRLRGEAVTRDVQDKAHHLLADMQLSHAVTLYPRELSGGMRQRVALARTLLEDTPIVLMDEPFTALDIVIRTRLQNLAAERLRGKTVLMVTHDPLEALRVSQHIYVLSGFPAALQTPLQLRSTTPRAVDDAEVLQQQAVLLKQLMHAQEGCVDD